MPIICPSIWKVLRPWLWYQRHLGAGSYRFSFMVIDYRGDPQLGNGSQSKFGGDANFGVYLRSTNYSVGLAANQLFASKFNFLGNDEANIQNARHFYLMGNYRFDLNEKFGLEPGLSLDCTRS